MGSLIKARKPSKPISMQTPGVIAQTPSWHLEIRAVGAGKPPMSSLIKARKSSSATSIQPPRGTADQTNCHLRSSGLATQKHPAMSDRIRNRRGREATFGWAPSQPADPCSLSKQIPS